MKAVNIDNIVINITPLTSKAFTPLHVYLITTCI